MGILLTESAGRCTDAVRFIQEMDGPESRSAACFLTELYVMSFGIELSSDVRQELNVLERECGMGEVRMGDRDRRTDPLDNGSYIGISRWLREYAEGCDEHAVLMLAMMSE